MIEKVFHSTKIISYEHVNGDTLKTTSESDLHFRPEKLQYSDIFLKIP